MNKDLWYPKGGTCTLVWESVFWNSETPSIIRTESEDNLFLKKKKKLSCTAEGISVRNNTEYNHFNAFFDTKTKKCEPNGN